jgi:hypothetical protein
MQQAWRQRHFGLLFVLALVLTLGTLLQDFRFDRWIAGERASLDSLTRTIGSLEATLAELRGAQIGYLATGRGPDAWMQQTTALFARLETTVTSLREAPTTSAAALPRYEAATTALANLGSLDRRARDQILNDQRFLAADTILVDGEEVANRLKTELVAARDADAASRETRLQRLSQVRLAVNAAAAGVILVFAFVMGRPARPTRQSEADAIAQMFRELPPAVKTPAARPAASAAPVPPVSQPTPAPAPAVAQAPAAPPVLAVNLPDAADLCVDLARVIDGRDVPVLLERTAEVLNAKGLIIWTVDASGTTLVPTLTHGYSGKVLTKLGTLAVDADNVTSLSFRSMRPQLMAGEPPSGTGAMAVPLITAAGCSGVLSAEVRESMPPAEMLALTRILAAQFATIVGPSAEASGDATVAQAAPRG